MYHVRCLKFTSWPIPWFRERMKLRYDYDTKVTRNSEKMAVSELREGLFSPHTVDFSTYQFAVAQRMLYTILHSFAR